MAAATIWKRTALAALFAVQALAAWAQDPPGRIARLSAAAHGVEWAAPQQAWQAADPNWPLARGDRLRVSPGSRAELHAGAHALRLQGPAELEFTALDADELRLTLRQGSLNLQVRERAPGERIEVDTQNLALLVESPGEFRVDVDAAGGTTRVLAYAGSAQLFGENGESAMLPPARQARYAGRDLAAVDQRGAGPRDGLDQWAADRRLAEDRSVSAQYLSRETIGYQELDAYGEWASDAQYGAVWYPRVASADWAPYRHGQWRWIAPWGWTWMEDARWGFAPFHYGRWVQIGPRWAWAPGPRTSRPSFAPRPPPGFAGPPPGGAMRPGGPPPFHGTSRERPPPPGLGLPPPSPGLVSNVEEQQRRMRWQREQQQREEQRRQQQVQDDLNRRHEQIRRDQLQRESFMRQHQRTLQEQQPDPMWRQRQQMDRPPPGPPDPQRQHERFMREQQRAQRELQRPPMQQPLPRDNAQPDRRPPWRREP
ncbi:DUF6600 domain-containing protein [Pseudorhodoferax sp.]|uniref:DUF6600 domain-containing protein n=1 Tax=Pseudorhodoferax sp. TaxID=1993553 RepID=UPI0039E6A1F9